MRLFIAAEIDEKNKKLIHRIQERYKGSSSGGTFTRQENYHITLRFIGETGSDLVPRIMLAMDRAASESSPFVFSVGAPGYFKRREGIVLFLGIEKGSENLWKIAEILGDELIRGGFPDGREVFTPHITLGRKVRLRKEFNSVSEELDIPDISVHTGSITLMESVREKGLLRYKPIYSSKLRL